MIIVDRNCILAINLFFPLISFQILECCVEAAIFRPHCSGYFFGLVAHVAPQFFCGAIISLKPYYPLPPLLLIFVHIVVCVASCCGIVFVLFQKCWSLFLVDRSSSSLYGISWAAIIILIIVAYAFLVTGQYSLVDCSYKVLLPIHGRSSSSIIALNTVGC
jgi:hypothetical protein